MDWPKHFRINPLIPLGSAQNPALRYWITRDVLEIPVEPRDVLWSLPEPCRLIKKQLTDGSWKYPGKPSNADLGTNYFLLETFRTLRILVEKYGFTRAHPALEKAAEYVLSCQTEEGDIRGILSNQYMPYYMGCLLELLIKAGYEQDRRITKGLNWLLYMRQNDGGWIIPLQMYKITYLNEVANTNPIPPVYEKPFSHLATGMVLRAFASHPDFRIIPEIRKAGSLLKSRILKQDAYNDHKSPKYWAKFQYPFWWTDLLSALDTLERLGFSREDADIARGLDWFISNQSDSGLWKAYYEKRPERDEWVSMAVCRTFRRFFEK